MHDKSNQVTGVGSGFIASSTDDDAEVALLSQIPGAIQIAIGPQNLFLL